MSGRIPAVQAGSRAKGDETGDARPRLVFFYSPTSGACRRAEAFLAQALQRRRNHETFELVRVDADARPELAERFRVDELPTLVIVERHRVVRRIVAPQGSRQLQRELSRWLH
jgi:thioredoxin-like negative regulator of GroEL